MASTSITIRIDEDLKREMEALCEDMGINLSTAYMIFTKTAVRQWRIPFEVAGDTFYSESNQRRLAESIEEGKKGKFITKSMEELRALADE